MRPGGRSDRSNHSQEPCGLHTYPARRPGNYMTRRFLYNNLYIAVFILALKMNRLWKRPTNRYRDRSLDTHFVYANPNTCLFFNSGSLRYNVIGSATNVLCCMQLGALFRHPSSSFREERLASLSESGSSLHLQRTRPQRRLHPKPAVRELVLCRECLTH